ncbi:hypothetical protein [Polaromonas sp. UBA4122]|uniref:hypothetical protein n=1 Tax=Polaromonas sp. UBA4122 TaxID=1947074 RepID=UPI0025EA89B3|nr:hypothetical protein [Polaromonas sp. UBA4122]
MCIESANQTQRARHAKVLQSSAILIEADHTHYPPHVTIPAETLASLASDLH